MATMKIDFDTTTPAFGEDRLAECARILERLAAELRAMQGGYPYGSIRDTAGEHVGSWVITE